MSEMRTCGGCGKDLTHTHGSRKWCSERCRRRTLYTTSCRHCGAEVYDGSSKPPDECGACKYERTYAPRNEEIFRLWNDGEPGWYIAEQLGLKESTVFGLVETHRVRYGKDLLPHRLGGNAAERERRHRQMIVWRKEGKTNREIAALSGMSSRESVNQCFQMMKRKGWDIPPAPPVAA